tara:strand:- start:6213 stop:7310 length:1098 start_codon:yes stop_codon:yes gene_type:complete
MDPELGKRSAEEAQNEIREILKDTDMVFITCGLGGGTGSGAAPVIAEIARELGALTVGVVTKPFTFEGPQRKNIAAEAYNELSQYVDTIITIPNDRVLQIIDKKTPMLEAFQILDDVLRQGVQGISELITVPGLINVDFADVKTIMKNQGSALMGIGIAAGENRAIEAAKTAISSPLLELSIEGARGILFTITGGSTLGMQEVSEAAQIITDSADDGVKVIFGAVIDESMGEDVRVTVVATGFSDSFSQERKKHTSEISHKESDDSEPEEQEEPVFTRPKSYYSSGPFTKKRVVEEEKELDIEIEDEEDDDDVFGRTFATKQVSSRPESNTATKPQRPTQTEDVSEEDGEDDLEIPAFIRKKMGM